MRSRLGLLPRHESLHLTTTAEARVGWGELLVHVRIVLADAQDLLGLLGSRSGQIAATRNADGVDTLIVGNSKDEIEFLQTVFLGLGEVDPNDGEDDDDIAGGKEGVGPWMSAYTVPADEIATLR